jgi:hypothetical protein
VHTSIHSTGLTISSENIYCAGTNARADIGDGALGVEGLALSSCTDDGGWMVSPQSHPSTSTGIVTAAVTAERGGKLARAEPSHTAT